MEELEENNTGSIYVHIPFCNNICTYCDFSKIYYNENIVGNYLNVLKKELNLKYNNEIYDTIYIGGGTPSSLNIKELNRLLEILSVIKKNSVYEYTFECNPESMNIEKIKLLKKYGINRVSIGVQTFDLNCLKLLNRKHTNNQVFDLINNLNKEGITNINIDMMFAIPNQTILSLEKDLDIISKLNIKHISYYSLILEEHTRLYINKFKEFDDDKEYKMYNIISNKLKQLGFNKYEISNFSKKGYESIHNKNYWLNGNYIGIGLSACSKYNDKIITNTKNINKYLNLKFDTNITCLNKTDIYYNDLMLGLRLTNGINKKEFKNKYDKNIEDVFNFNNEIKYNRIIDDGFNIFINPKYIYVSNDIILKIIMEGINE